MIVVNMFLTGFDATTLNTLWVDKNLRLHGLLQAFSRTNRVLNSVKTYGNIVCFRDLEQNTHDSISLFGNKDAGGVVLLRPYAEYYAEYKDLIEQLSDEFPPGVLPAGEVDQKTFINVYNQILRLKNILQSFDDFAGSEILPPAVFQDYQSTYIELYRNLRETSDHDKESILDDIVFEIELVKQVEINVDYILLLVKELQGTKGAQNKEILAKIDSAVSSSFSLRSKKDLIEAFVASLNTRSDVDSSWREFVDQAKFRELSVIIDEENLVPAATRAFVDQAFRDGVVQGAGPALSRLLPPRNMFSPTNEHGVQKRRVLARLQTFFDRFFIL